MAYFVGLSQTVDPSHFAFLVGITKNAARRFFAGNWEDEILPEILHNVLAQFSEQSRGPFLFDFRFLILQSQEEKNGNK